MKTMTRCSTVQELAYGARVQDSYNTLSWTSFGQIGFLNGEKTYIKK